MADDRYEPLVSVVIPVLDDAAMLAAALPRVIAQLSGVSAEVIVSSGAPLDDATEAVRRVHASVRWVTSEPGRAVQMNAGAAAARGLWLLFLHADTVLADGWPMALEALAVRPAAAGCFRFALDSAVWQARIIERGVAFRVRCLGLPYGDQALFVRRSVFEALGGYAPLPLMEDVELVRRLRAGGHRLDVLPLEATTSARRWQQDGWMRRSLTNMLLVTLYHLHVSPARLRAWYHRGSPSSARPRPVPAVGRRIAIHE